ncbi:MAG: glutathione S-transferase family protein [Spongiibacteraceae bacterium]
MLIGSAAGAVKIRLHGSDISYFSGKLENYFRVKGIPYTFCPFQGPTGLAKIAKKVGVPQIPALELDDGRWMTDTTKIIQWFEAELPKNSLFPDDPLQRFLCLLIEDYADEWLWRPAMHYRWHYEECAQLLSRHIVDTHMANIPLPRALIRSVFRFRQRRGYTRGDGISTANVPGVEQIYLSTLAQLQGIFSRRPFIFGDRPSLADIGLSGPFFRHFALDPVPLEIMRQQAPAVFEWVARLWNFSQLGNDGSWCVGVPDDIGPLLKTIGASYLPYLCANAEAVAANRNRFDTVVDKVGYRGARSSRYRVWCLQELRTHFLAMPEDARASTQQLLEQFGCWEPLWRIESLPLTPGQEQELPFHGSSKMLDVYE